MDNSKEENVTKKTPKQREQAVEQLLQVVFGVSPEQERYSREEIEEVLPTLPPRLQEVIQAHLEGRKGPGMKEVLEEREERRARIRQLEAKAVLLLHARLRERRKSREKAEKRREKEQWTFLK